MSGVAIVTDSASDLPPEQAQGSRHHRRAAARHLRRQGYRAGVDLSAEDFWRELTAPGAPFPKTAAAAPGHVQGGFRGALRRGRRRGRLCRRWRRSCRRRWAAPRSRATCSAERTIHVVDSNTASMGVGLLALSRGRDGRRRRIRRRDRERAERSAGRRSSSTSSWRRSSTSSAAAASARPGRRSAASCRSSRSSPSRTAWSRRPIGRAPAGARASA